MSGFEVTTDGIVAEPWLVDPADVHAPVLHLVMAWCFDEPGRVGQAARVGPACWLGRPSESTDPIRFVEQRPGETRAVPVWSSTRVSRRQLSLTRLDADRALVENVGQRALWVNGRPAQQAEVVPGDTLMIEASAVLLVEMRPRTFAPLQHYRSAAFGFGRADAHGMVGESAAAWLLRDQLAAAARGDAHLLLLGATGAGKEVAARVVHGLSPRARGPMVARNAATIPGTLMDAELFGNARHYPNTGAPERPGLVGSAHGGHLLLDEIGEMPPGHQAHLLRVLDAGGQYQRLGEATPRSSDFRLLAATNRDPSSLKHDFLARFAQRVTVPDLNQRRSDIPLLIQEWLRRKAQETPEVVAPFFDTAGQHARVDPRLVECLLRHQYTHHARELGRLLSVALATSRGGYLSVTPEFAYELRASEIAESPVASQQPAVQSQSYRARSSARSSAARPAAQHSTEQLVQALEATNGNVSQAAKLLGISRHALTRLMKAQGLVRRFDATD